MGTVQVPAKFPTASFWDKINPSWWFKNDYQQTVQEATWYHPEWPEWKRELYWNYFRNPLQNFDAVVLGIQDKTFNVTSTAADPMLHQRNDIGETGFVSAILHGGDLWIPRPFVSYSGEWLVWYAGWKPSGVFGLKLNFPILSQVFG